MYDTPMYVYTLRAPCARPSVGSLRAVPLESLSEPDSGSFPDEDSGHLRQWQLPYSISLSLSSLLLSLLLSFDVTAPAVTAPSVEGDPQADIYIYIYIYYIHILSEVTSWVSGACLDRLSRRGVLSNLVRRVIAVAREARKLAQSSLIISSIIVIVSSSSSSSSSSSLRRPRGGSLAQAFFPEESGSRGPRIPFGTG